MDAEAFRKYGHEVVDMIADYLAEQAPRKDSPTTTTTPPPTTTTPATTPASARRSLPSASSFPAMTQVQPGYLRSLIPSTAPELGEDFGAVLDDITRVVMPGMTHWQSKKFLAYFPARTCFESILADMFSGALNPIGFSWVCSPACTELEVVMMDWLAQALGLPAHFLSTSKDVHGVRGGGVIQGTASEVTLVCLLAARTRALARYGAAAAARLVCYTSEQAHSATEKACKIANVRYRALPADAQDNALRGATLATAMAEDVAAGLIPFYVVATLGTTALCAFDRVPELTQAVAEFVPPPSATEAVVPPGEPAVWLHVDAAYAGSFLLCPELRHLFVGAHQVGWERERGREGWGWGVVICISGSSNSITLLQLKAIALTYLA